MPKGVAISLDHELRWGVYDWAGRDVDVYRHELLDDREWATPSLLGLLTDRGLSATWAVVGAMGCADWNDYARLAPPAPPYARSEIRIGPWMAELDPEGELHFAPDHFELIRAARGQELGTHTFHHLCLAERGVGPHHLTRDLEAVRALHRERGWDLPASLVFPRNQCRYPEVVAEAGITAWRDVESVWYWDVDRTSGWRRPAARGLRFLDGLLPLGHRSSTPAAPALRQSLFVRLTIHETLWRAHLERVRRALDTVAEGEVLHLWWHPHNMGGHGKRGLQRAEQLLDLLLRWLDAGPDRVSANMADLIEPARWPARRTGRTTDESAG